MPTLRDIVYGHVREGELYEKLYRNRVRCFACCHCCPIPEGQPLTPAEYEEGKFLCPYCGSEEVEQRASAFYPVSSEETA